MLDEHFITFGYVEVCGRRDLAQIAGSFSKHRGSGPPIVDIKRPPVVQRDAEIMASSKSVIPGQPITQNRWVLIQTWHDLPQHLLVGGQHAVGGNDTFGKSG